MAARRLRRAETQARARPPVSSVEFVAGAIDLRVPALSELHQRRSDKWVGYNPDVIVATIAEMDFPIATPISEALHAAIDRHDMGYAPTQVPRLARAFAEFADRRLHWTVDPAQTVLVPDVMLGVLELARLLAGPSRTVAFATPAYPPFLAEPPYFGLSVHEVPMRPDGALDLDDVAAMLAAGTRVLIVANPHNPTGRVLQAAELAQIAELCEANDAWVIADEIHAPLTLPGARYTPWLEVSEAARTCGFAVTSASKAFNLAGLKAALLVTASERTQDLAAELPPLSDHAGLLGVIAAEVAFTEGDEWLDAVVHQLDANRALLAAQLDECLPAVVWTPPQATYLAWLDFRPLGLGDAPAQTLLDRARVALSPGLDYGRRGAGFARLNFGTSPDLVAEMIHRIAHCLPGSPRFTAAGA
jgi:cystathionine beta-lyase